MISYILHTAFVPLAPLTRGPFFRSTYTNHCDQPVSESERWCDTASLRVTEAVANLVAGLHQPSWHQLACSSFLGPGALLSALQLLG